MKVIVPVFENTVSASVTGIMDILNYSKSFHDQLYPDQKDRKTFEVELMSVGGSLEVNNNGFFFRCHSTLETTAGADIIIMPALIGDVPALINQHGRLIAWLKTQYDSGAFLCSTCNGAFFIGATGLLNGKEATTSWFSSEAFKMMFPLVNLSDEKIIVDAGRIITGGATLSFTNLCIYLIEKYHGRQLGNYCAKVFLVDKGKNSQQSFSIFMAQKNHEDEEIRKAQDFIEEKATDKISVAEVSGQVTMSERSFIRRFKAATGNTPSEYIQRVKVELAKRMLEEGRETVKEVSFTTGYEDLNYFRDIFKRHTGLTPMEYKRQFSFEFDEARDFS